MVFGYRKIGDYSITYEPDALVISKLIAVSMNDCTFTDREYAKMLRIAKAILNSECFDVAFTGVSSTCIGFRFYYRIPVVKGECYIDLEREINFIESLLKEC